MSTAGTTTAAIPGIAPVPTPASGPGRSRVIGPYATVYAIRLPELNAMITDVLARPVGVFALGVLLLGGGLVIVGGHCNWRGPAAVVVSLFGWFVTLRGVLLIATPGTVQASVDSVMASPSAILAFRAFFGALALVGLFLAWVGWFGNRVTAVESGTAERPATSGRGADG
ncbi:hypothetical protein [Pseudonocardia endophytica]|uniref:Uncharacterized protein n=1 Tax=Pseudonocardia endophytica TaxID=401976 RepID=A0A4R1HR88_PSEEN|nr:hypothetical protein [Pseudonocardia endophytica]TCK24658.1 hypothetical protein EV378_0440 [Pseudonocardia endophytica]